MTEHVNNSDRNLRESRHVLMDLVSQGSKHSLISLISEGVSPNFVDEQGESPITLACSDGNVEIVATLLSCGADVNIVDGASKTALCYSVMYLYYEIAKLLLRNGASLDRCEGSDNAIKVCARGWSVQMLSVLLPYASVKDIDSFGGDGLTPLMEAVGIGDLAMATALIECGADVNRSDIRGWDEPALFVAVHNPVQSIIELLVKSGADVNVRDSYGRRPLDLYLRYHQGQISSDIVAILS